MLTGNTPLQNQAVNFDLTLFDSLLSRENLLDPVKQTSNAYLDILPYAYGWNRKIRRLGGFWEGVFNMSTNPPVGYQPIDRETALEIFYSKLGLHLEEREAGEGNLPTWQGYIHEIYLSTANSQRVRSYDTLANRLLIVDSSNCTIIDTLDNEESILRYGLIEKIVDVSKLSDTGTNISDYLNQQLKTCSWAYPNFVSRIASTADITLQIRVRGYIFTSAFKYFIQSFIDTPIIDAVTAIINNSDYLTLNDLEDNQLLITNDYCENGLKALIDLVNLGSVNNPLWTINAYNDRGINYNQLDPTTPTYYINLDGTWADRQGGNIAVNPRRLQPAIVEDTFYPILNDEPNNLFTKSNVFLAEQISVRPDNTPEYTTNSLFDEVEDIHVISEAKQAFKGKSFSLEGVKYGLNGFSDYFTGA